MNLLGFGTPCYGSRGRAAPGLVAADRGPPWRLGAEPGRIQAGHRVAVAEELRPGQQGHHRLGESEHHHDVDQHGQAEGVGEALDLADGEVVQQQRGQERHRVGHQDRAPGALPPGLDRRAQLFALAHLVAQSLEVDDERVGGDADRHDQAGDAGQLEGEVLVQGEQHHRQVGDAVPAMIRLHTETRPRPR